ncbi:hypothetical protein ACWIGG_28410 [Micromonospora aurantiaca (nom. illeg.)]|uniref:hypothetical protein n=1 Tax=Micromonospora aurantiaca (nom. illeg.) TaxID=47850 RepID=UPI00165719DD|nr:hypothetical protein [Micromonospora aurantiaca]MBC9005437.1 hypothetical protein [Micromonospora aurantiaca]
MPNRYECWPAARSRQALYLPIGRDELLRRLPTATNEDVNALTVSPEALDDFFARFDAPADDEDVIIYPAIWASS